MTVKDIMHEITIVEPDISVLEVARIMRDRNIGSVLVKLSGLDWGIATERDILIKVISKNLDVKTTKVSDIMTKLQYTIDSNASIRKASEIFNVHHIRRLPVMEGGEIIGIITSRDVAKRCIFESLRTKVNFSRGKNSKKLR